MKKKLVKIISIVLALAFSVGLMAGCDLFIGVDSTKDMQQVIAEVNIGEDKEALSSAFDALGADLDDGVASRTDEILSTDEIYKRDLVAYFLTYGYSYVSSGSYTYAETFELLLDALINSKINAQMAMLYYLSEGEVLVDRDNTDSHDGYTAIDGTDALRMDGDISLDGYLSAVNAAEGNDEQAIAGYEYFLTEDEVNYATYIVMLSINNTLDTYEEDIIAESEEGTTGSDTRTVPEGANVLADTYYPSRTEDGVEVIDYGIYTGFNNVSDCGEYEKVEGSTTYTRTRAYARFLNALRQNNLVSEGDENSYDIVSLDYFKMELRNQLQAMVINKFVATINLGMTDTLEEQTLQNIYTQLVTDQTVGAQSDFISTMDGISDTSFVLYSPEDHTYGYVYNILLPFSADQELVLSEIAYADGTKEYYAARNTNPELLRAVEGTDQRAAWFNGETDYSYLAEGDYYVNAANAGRDNYLFFKDSYVTSDDGIARYAGKYPYNGSVEELEDDTYKLTPEKLNIDEFITEMQAYINYVAGADVASGGYYAGKDASGNASWTASTGDAFYNVTAADFLKADGRTIDQSANIYYKGSVAGVSDVSAADYLLEDEISYKALSAVNELMFTYTTDTACLETYYGYSIESIETATSYVAEFEFAAQDLITNAGAGAYAVVAADFGWHIIYVSFVFDGGLTYEDGFVYDDRNVEGTFSYYFYQANKQSLAEDYASDRQSEYNILLNNDSSVTRYESRYADLMEMDEE